MKTKRFTFLLLSLPLLLTSCFTFNSIKGNGDLVTEEISISDYDEISIAGTSAVVNYEQSESAPALKVTTDQNVYEMYEFKLNGRKLFIKPKEEYKKTLIRPTEFTITTQSKSLNEANLAGNIEFNLNSTLKGEKLDIDAAGKGTVNLKDSICVNEMYMSIAGKGTLNAQAIFADRFEGETAGSGTMNLGGKIDQATFEIAGSGDINAYDLETTNTSCEIAGSGDAKVNATGQLNVSIAGRGSVRYKGSPNISKSIAGFGSVKQTD